jgi:hypothetical protein
MSGWQEREAYFKKHGPTPKKPYIERSECGCYTVWETPKMGAGYKCPHCASVSAQEMAGVQRRRRAFFEGR